MVPNECPPSWPADALRAQAVAARSYALATSASGNGFDLYDDTRSQVYGGLGSETAATNAAVGATRAEVVKFHGRVADDVLLLELGRPDRERRERLRRLGPDALPEERQGPVRATPPRTTTGGRPSRSREIEAKLGGLVQGSLQVDRGHRSAAARRGSSRRSSSAARVRPRSAATTLQSRLGLRSTWAFFDKSG